MKDQSGSRGSTQSDREQIDEQSPPPTRSYASRRNIAVVGIAAIAAGTAVVALQQAQGISSSRQLNLYSNPVTGGLFKLLFAHSVKTVNLSSASLAAAPLALLQECFVNLRSLNLSNNPITVLPCQISCLTTLAKLNMARCQLTKLPDAISTLQRLIDLDLGHNRISILTPSIGALTSLKYLNVMNNNLTSLPESIGNLGALYRLGLKSNALTALPESFGGLTSLVELFLTNNELVTLPASIGQCASLVKLQASFNKLTSLPDEIGNLPNLEFIRVAVNQLPSVPASMARLSNLAWVAIAGNPICPSPPLGTHHIESIQLGEITRGPYLGEGASGEVFEATWRGQPVAIKMFKADVSPDGRARDEIDVACFVDHPNLTKVIASVETPTALVKELVPGKSMADKPNFASLLRCRWRPGLQFRPRYVLRVAGSVARALRYMHSHGICHGDVYAHNVLADADGNAVLCDYGASFFYDRETAPPWETVEVRAFGLLLKDLVERYAGDARVQSQLQVLTHACCYGSTDARPGFDAICRDIDAMMADRSLG